MGEIRSMFLAEGGIALDEQEAKELAEVPKKDRAERVGECVARRKVRQFSGALADLEGNADVIPAVLRLLADREHPMSKAMLKENPGLTHEQILAQIEEIRQRAERVSTIFSKRGITFFILATVVAVLAAVLYRLLWAGTPHQKVF